MPTFLSSRLFWAKLEMKPRVVRQKTGLCSQFLRLTLAAIKASNARTDRAAIRFGSDQLHLEPVIAPAKIVPDTCFRRHRRGRDCRRCRDPRWPRPLSQTAFPRLNQRRLSCGQVSPAAIDPFRRRMSIIAALLYAGGRFAQSEAIQQTVIGGNIHTAVRDRKPAEVIEGCNLVSA